MHEQLNQWLEEHPKARLVNANLYVDLSSVNGRSPHNGADLSLTLDAFIVEKGSHLEEAFPVLVASPDKPWAAYAINPTLSSQGPTSLAAQLLWQHNLGNVIKYSLANKNCGGKEYTRARGDKTMIRSVCLEGLMAVVVEGDEAPNLLLMSASQGSLIGSWRLGNFDEIVDIDIDDNKIAILCNNLRDRRQELTLFEFYTDVQTVGVKEWVAMSPTVEPKAPELKVYQEKFALNRNDLSELSLTYTGERITPQSILFGSRSNNVIYTVDAKLVSARRGLNAKSKQLDANGNMPDATIEVGLPDYEPYMELKPIGLYPENVEGAKMNCLAGSYESSTSVQFLKDNFSSAISDLEWAPAGHWDRLPDDFSRTQTLGSLIGMLLALVYVLWRIRKSQQKIV